MDETLQHTHNQERLFLLLFRQFINHVENFKLLSLFRMLKRFVYL
jgi:hypothetical protein